MQSIDLSVLDDSVVSTSTAIIGAAAYTYRLLTMVRSGKVLRIIDPSAAMWNKACSKTLQCEHTQLQSSNKSDTAAIPVPDSEIMAAWSFEELLGDWDIKNWDDTKPWVTKVLDSHLKLNVAMSLSPKSTVVKGPKCCLRCAMEMVNKIDVGNIGAARSILNQMIEPGKLVPA